MPLPLIPFVAAAVSSTTKFVTALALGGTVFVHSAGGLIITGGALGSAGFVSGTYVTATTLATAGVALATGTTALIGGAFYLIDDDGNAVPAPHLAGTEPDVVIED